MKVFSTVSSVVLFLLFLLIVQAADDYYKILGITRDASNADIKRAYRQLTLTKHPDKGGDADEFAKISHAYEVLSDSEKRRNYDQFGEENPNNGRSGGGFNPFDIFGGGGFGGFHFENSGQQGGGTEQLADTIIPVEVTLEDLYLGKTFKVLQRRQVFCHRCRGTGADDPSKDLKKCSSCGGTGMKVKTVRNGPFIQQMQSQCDVCGGKGKIISNTCTRCKGTKVEQEEEQLTVWIEQGMSDGSEVVFPQQGDEKPGYNPGDVKFVVHTQQHSLFVRKGDDLHTKMTIPLLDSLVGFTRIIKQLDGRNVTINRETVTRPGLTLKIVGEGMPIHSTPSLHGDLYIEFIIKFPQSITEDQKIAFRKILS